jgi:hypothetical protein
LILLAIKNAKNAAINDDIKEDKNRWLKLNRSGHSRYYETLTKMEDLVVKHWTADINEVYSFKNYQKISYEEFNELTEKFAARFKDYYTETYLEATDPRSKEVGRQLASIFSFKSDKLKMKDLNDKLDGFTSKNANRPDLQQVQNLMSSLKTAEPRLPGHLRTLAKEVLHRIEAMEQYLDVVAKRGS